MTVRKYLDANHPGAKVSSSSNHHSPSPSLTLTTDPNSNQACSSSNSMRCMFMINLRAEAEVRSQRDHAVASRSASCRASRSAGCIATRSASGPRAQARPHAPLCTPLWCTPSAGADGAHGQPDRVGPLLLPARLQLAHAARAHSAGAAPSHATPHTPRLAPHAPHAAPRAPRPARRASSDSMHTRAAGAECAVAARAHRVADSAASRLTVPCALCLAPCVPASRRPSQGVAAARG